MSAPALTAQAGAAAPVMLPPLRDELVLMPGPVSAEGWPTWTLLDPVRNKFFRLDWTAFEILSRWDGGTPEDIAERLRAETPLDVEAEDVEDVLKFVAGNSLLRPLGKPGTERLAASVKAMRHSWYEWLIHNYLFFRIPLLRPDRWLGRTAGWVEWAYSRAFALVTVAALALGLLLVGRQWESFVNGLVNTASLEGLAGYALALGLAKSLHELGHAYTAKRLGCRVPTMGLAFLVMMPVLYTDTTEAWKLTDRRHRLAVGAAGVAAELALAAWATLAWSLLPDGGARTVALVLGTTTWISTLLINTSPFMRFDGYFLAMDALDMPNLHGRAFAMARWQLREALFATGEPAPEPMAPWRRRALIAFAVATWIYRLTLFLGIAVLVYHFIVKLVGVVLFAIEIGFFVLMPVISELREWWKRRATAAATPQGRRTLVLAALALALALVPLRAELSAPALLQGRDHSVLYVPAGGLLTELHLSPGKPVAEGERLAVLDSPELRYRLAKATARQKVLEWQVATVGFTPEFREHAQSLEQELQGVNAERRAAERELARLEIRAPIAGVAVDLPPDLKAGQWIPAKERLGALRRAEGAEIQAYVDEDDVARLAPGAEARFYPEEAGRAPVTAWVETVERTAEQALSLPVLGSPFGGPVPARLMQDGSAIPDRAVYRVRLRVAGEQAPDAQSRGTVAIAAERRSLAGRLFRAVAAVLIREAGM